MSDVDLQIEPARQQGPKRKVPPGMVAVACGDTSRYTNFSASISRTVAGLDPESGTLWSVSSSVADNCNIAAEALVEADTAMDWLFILGDDHEWDQDLLPELLAAMYEHDLDILVPLCFARSWPPRFVIYDREEEGVTKTVEPETVAEIMRSGKIIREVFAAGTAGMVVRRRVFEGIEFPYFRNVLLGPTQETGIISQTGEDINFCRLARIAGFHVWAHFGLVLGHIRPITLVPEMDAEGLFMRLLFGAPHGPKVKIA